MARPGVRQLRLRVVMLAFVAVMVVALVGASPASAHALAQSSDPPAGASLAQSPKMVTIVFGERPDPRLSSIKVLDTAGNEHQQGHSGPVPGRPDALEVAVTTLPQGVYTVSWRTVSQVDGHLASGSFSFGVGVAPTSTTASASVVHSPPASPWSVVTRWLLYAGVMLLAGVALIGLLTGASARLVRLAAAGGLLAAIGVVGLAQQQRQTAGLSLDGFWQSSLAHQMLWRAVPVAAALAAVIWLARKRTSRLALGVVGLTASLAMFGDVDASHAAGSRSWRWLDMASQWLHFASAGVWIGGLTALIVVLPLQAAEQRRDLARRFSTVAAIALGLVAITGTQRGLTEVRSWHGLFDTTFGRWVIVKIGLLAAISTIGLFNRTRAVPAAVRSGRLLRRAGSLEVILAAVVLVATGFLQSLAPPSSSAAQPKPTPPLVATGNDLGTTIKTRLEISPGTAGFNKFVLRAADFDTAKPVAADVVSLTFTLPTRPDLGDSRLDLTKQPDGTYQADAPNLSVNGTWTVTALIQWPGGSAEVPLIVTTRQPPVTIDVSRSPGLPDVYTVHVNAADTIQVYLDPDHPGLNEFHVTMIGSGGSELPTDKLTVAASGPAGGSPSTLTVRKLDTVGHFVADLPDATTGRYRFSVDTITSNGPPLHADITIPVA